MKKIDNHLSEQNWSLEFAAYDSWKSNGSRELGYE